MDKIELGRRTRSFAVRTFRLLDQVPYTQASRVVVHQLLRAASSVAVNYRAVNRAKSRADFGNKLKIVLEEADESLFWLGFVGDVGVIEWNNKELHSLLNECDQLVAIFTAVVRTVNESKSVSKSKILIRKS